VKSIKELLLAYHETMYTEERVQLAHQLLERAPTDPSAVDALLFVLNDLGDSKVRLEIVDYLASTRPPSAVRGLTKSTFDPDPLVRARAALGVAAYDDAHVLAPSLSALLDAVSDPVTREPAERAIRIVTGRGPDKITVSERERLRVGDSPQSIWVDHFARLRALATDDAGKRAEPPQPETPSERELPPQSENGPPAT
jgi:HEAT repeat protein